MKYKCFITYESNFETVELVFNKVSELIKYLSEDMKRDEIEALTLLEQHEC